MNKNIFQWTTLTGALFLTCCKKPDFTIRPTAGSVGTINQYLQNNFDLSLFAAAVQEIGFADSLDVPTDSFTVFAPTNEALNKEGVFTSADFNSWPKDSLTQFVKIHIVAGKIFFDNIPTTPDTRYTDLAGISLFVTNGEQNLTVNGVIVQPVSTLGASTGISYGSAELNGLVYPLNNTIKASTETVADFLSGRPDLSCLVKGLKKFGYWDKLQGQGPFTVFAPPDSIFLKRAFTVDSIDRMDTSRFDPVVFGGYFLTPNHVFISDMRNLPPPININDLPFLSPDSKYDLMIAQANAANGVGVLTDSSAKVNNPVFVGPNANLAYSRQGTPFLGETSSPAYSPVGTYINFTFSNGVVHMLADLLVMPNHVEK